MSPSVPEFSGPPEGMRETIRQWFVAHLKGYGGELAALTLDESWLAHVAPSK